MTSQTMSYLGVLYAAGSSSVRSKNAELSVFLSN
jgi:hypothetical protein